MRQGPAKSYSSLAREGVGDNDKDNDNPLHIYYSTAVRPPSKNVGRNTSVPPVVENMWDTGGGTTGGGVGTTIS